MKKVEKKGNKAKQIISNILFNLIGFFAPVVIYYFIDYNFGDLTWFVLIPVLITVLYFKRTRIGAIAIIVISLLLYITLPLIKIMQVQNTCDTYGEGFKPVRRVYDNKGKEGYSNAQTDAFEWACCPSDAQGITGTANIEELTAAGCIGAK